MTLGTTTHSKREAMTYITGSILFSALSDQINTGFVAFADKVLLSTQPKRTRDAAVVVAGAGLGPEAVCIEDADAAAGGHLRDHPQAHERGLHRFGLVTRDEALEMVPSSRTRPPARRHRASVPGGSWPEVPSCRRSGVATYLDGGGLESRRRGRVRPTVSARSSRGAYSARSTTTVFVPDDRQSVLPGTVVCSRGETSVNRPVLRQPLRSRALVVPASMDWRRDAAR